jgi:Zn-dependent protease with chaperone function
MMEHTQFENTVERLTLRAARAPRRYKLEVALFAAASIVVLVGIVALLLIFPLAVAGLLVLVISSGHVGGLALVLAKLGKAAVLLVPAVWMPLRTAFEAVFTRLSAPSGTAVARAQAPALFAALDNMRLKMRGPRFHHVLINDELNAGVVQRPLFGVLGWQRNYLVLGLPLLETLTPEEAMAVVAHEYGHLSGAHNRFGAFIYRLRHSWGGIEDMAAQWRGWGGRALAKLLRWFAPRFNAYTFVLARAHEYQADVASVELVGADAAKTALVRVAVASRRYSAFWQRQMARHERNATPPELAYDVWARVAPSALAHTTQTTQYLQSALAEQTGCADTHPSLADRLAALGVAGAADAATTDEAALALLPSAVSESAAQAWLGAHASTLRNDHQRVWREGVADFWRMRHEDHQQSLARRAELQALLASGAALDADLHWEHWQLMPEAGQGRGPVPQRVAAAQAFVAAWPEECRAYYALGFSRLAEKDAQGIADMERCMSIEVEFTMAACARVIEYLPDDDPRMAEWRARYQARSAFEDMREQEKSNIDVKHVFAEHGASAEQWAAIETFVRARKKGISRAWFARRLLPSAPDEATYVLALQLTGWAQYWERDQTVVDRFDGFPFPEHVMVCTVSGGYAPLRKVLRKLGATAIDLRG